LNNWANLIRSSNHDGLNYESSFEDDVMEYEEKAEDDPQEILLKLENHIEELKDHKMDLIVDKEAPMQILNLIL
jgi:hypothetical protein